MSSTDPFEYVDPFESTDSNDSPRYDYTGPGVIPASKPQHLAYHNYGEKEDPYAELSAKLETWQEGDSVVSLLPEQIRNDTTALAMVGKKLNVSGESDAEIAEQFSQKLLPYYTKLEGDAHDNALDERDSGVTGLGSGISATAQSAWKGFAKAQSRRFSAVFPRERRYMGRPCTYRPRV